MIERKVTDVKNIDYERYDSLVKYCASEKVDIWLNNNDMSHAASCWEALILNAEHEIKLFTSECNPLLNTHENALKIIGLLKGKLDSLLEKTETSSKIFLDIIIESQGTNDSKLNQMPLFKEILNNKNYKDLVKFRVVNKKIINRDDYIKCVETTLEGYRDNASKSSKRRHFMVVDSVMFRDEKKHEEPNVGYTSAIIGFNDARYSHILLRKFYTLCKFLQNFDKNKKSKTSKKILA